MDIQAGARAQRGRIRRLHPFDIEELGDKRDANFWIEIKEESLVDVAQRWDKYKYKPGADKESQTKAVKVGLASIVETILNWGGEDGGPGLTKNGAAVPCDDKNKEDFAERQYPIGEEWRTGWALTMEALDRQKKEELGNAPSSSPTTSASA